MYLALTIPALVLMILFIAAPLVNAVRISFFKWNGYSQKMRWYGLKNFGNIFTDKLFWSATLNTFIYGFGSTILQNIFGLAAALFLNNRFKGRNAVRVILYMPIMISAFIMGQILYYFVQVEGGVFNELLGLGVIPIVNENDSISTYELQNLEKFGDNDTLSAVVAALVQADLLILLSDIDGLFTDDPNTNPDAKFIDVVESLDDELLDMGKGTSGSKVGTGGMATKLTAAQIASATGVDMVIANGSDFHVIHKITEGRNYGTLFVSQPKEEVYLIDIIDRLL